MITGKLFKQTLNKKSRISMRFKQAKETITNRIALKLKFTKKTSKKNE